jgi:methylaspartate ammonia-lyase
VIKVSLEKACSWILDLILIISCQYIVEKRSLKSKMTLTRVHPIDVRFVSGISGYFHKDLQAVKLSPDYDPLVDNVAAVTPGFESVVQAGEVISILIRLPNGSVAIGDCADVIFSGAASRDPLFIPAQHLQFLNTVVRPWLLKCDVSIFRPNAVEVEAPWEALGNKRLHTAVRYGLTQALLSATALVWHCTISEVISREWMVDIKYAFSGNSCVLPPR